MTASLISSGFFILPWLLYFAVASLICRDTCG